MESERSEALHSGSGAGASATVTAVSIERRGVSDDRATLLTVHEHVPLAARLFARSDCPMSFVLDRFQSLALPSSILVR